MTGGGLDNESNEFWLACWRSLCERTEDIEELGIRMKSELEQYETFRGIRKECGEIWSKERDRRNNQPG